MKRPDAVVVRAVKASPGPIGFAVRDNAGRGCAFEVDEKTGEALVFGSESALRVCAPGVLPAHFVVLPYRGRLMAASGSASHPAVVNGAPLPTTWTLLEVPSRIRLGAAAVDFFYIHESGTVLIDQDVETTVAKSPRAPPPPTFDGSSPIAPRVDLGSGTTRTRPMIEPERRAESGPTRIEGGCRPPAPPAPPTLGRLPRPSPLPMRSVVAATPRIAAERPPTDARGADTGRGRMPPRPVFRPAIAPACWPAVSARDLAGAASLYAQTIWAEASTSIRVAVGVAALVFIFLLGRLGRDTAPAPTAGPAQGTAAMTAPPPTGVPAMPVTVAPPAHL